MDHVDKIITQWQTERPDLDVAAMAVIGRLARLYRLMGVEMEKNFHNFGLTSSGFDVLATLRRSGKPYALLPKDLIATTMVTSGTMTNRIDQLEKTGLIARIPSKNDKRCCLVTLTDEGLAIIEKAIVKHVETQDRLLDALSTEERKQLNRLLKSLMASLV